MFLLFWVQKKTIDVHLILQILQNDIENVNDVRCYKFSIIIFCVDLMSGIKSTLIVHVNIVTN